MSERYVWSRDEENYHGDFASPDEAVADALGQYIDGSVLVGVKYQPGAESYIDATLVIEHIVCQDEYSAEAADHWPDASNEQLSELTAELQKVVGDWLDRHKLRESFFLVRDVKKYVREAGEIREAEGGGK